MRRHCDKRPNEILIEQRKQILGIATVFTEAVTLEVQLSQFFGSFIPRVDSTLEPGAQDRPRLRDPHFDHNLD